MSRAACLEDLPDELLLKIFVALGKLPPVCDETEAALYERRLPFRTFDSPGEQHPGLRAYPFLGQVCKRWRQLLQKDSSQEVLWESLVIDFGHELVTSVHTPVAWTNSRPSDEEFRAAFAATRLDAARMAEFVRLRRRCIRSLCLMHSEGYWAEEGEFVNLQTKHNFSLAHLGLILGYLADKLEELRLIACNDFFGMGSPLGVLATLGNLRTLVIDDCHCRLYREPVAELGRLTSLEWLSLCAQERNGVFVFGIDSIPDTWKQLSRLQVLELRGNALVEQLPAWMPTAMPHLKLLDVSHCHRLDLAASLAGFSQLETLALQGLGLYETGSVPPEVTAASAAGAPPRRMKQLPDLAHMAASLSALNLSENLLGAVPAQLSQLPRLQQIDLSNNGYLKMPSPASSLLALQQLSWVDLRGIHSEQQSTFWSPAKCATMESVASLARSLRRRRRPRGGAAKASAGARGSGRVGVGSAVLTGLVVLGTVAYLLGRSKQGEPSVLDPFPAKTLVSLPQFQGGHAERLLWGTYRPGLYFGMRMRRPQSPLLGLMWVDPGRADPLNLIRHEAQQRDGLKQYGWLEHDGESFGVQQLRDEKYNITIAWAKRWCEEGCSSAGDIGITIGVSPWDAASHRAERALFEAQHAEHGTGAAQQQQAGEPEDYEGGQEEDYEVEELSDADAAELGVETTSQQRSRARKGPRPGTAISLFLYVANEDGSPLRFDPRGAAAALAAGAAGGGGAAGPATGHPAPVIGGTAEPVGDWSLFLGRRSSSSSSSDDEGGAGAGDAAATDDAPLSVHYLAVQTPHYHNLTDLVRGALYHSLYRQHLAGSRAYQLVLPNTAQPGANLAVLQITASRLPVRLDLALLAGVVAGQHLSTHSAAGARLAAVTGPQLEQLLAGRSNQFVPRFEETFGRMDSSHLPPGTLAVAKAALSNMLGGMGYWFGHSLVRVPGSKGQPSSVQPLWDAPLFSAVPSRSFFPRGFMWDEGFHQLLIRRWSPSTSREILAHWLDLMTAPGWIAREQILGAEARSRVPDEFVIQSPSAANPPTFFLLLSAMSERVAAAARQGAWDDATRADADFLRAAWPRLKGWYLWFNTTQAGPVPGSYRWRGREADSDKDLNPKTLTSGLDDYPRASHPSGEERHVDLRCWMARASRALATIGANLGMPDSEVSPFAATAALLEDFELLNRLHLDPTTGQYRDWGNHTEGVELRKPVMVMRNGRQQPYGEKRRVVHEAPRQQFVPHFGYVSLFPLLMHLMPADSPVLKQQLDLLRDPDHLWTEFGLRSLSKSSSLYNQYNTEHDPPYWRGPIWININYLAVQALHHYASARGPYSQQAAALHQQLRWNLLRNLVWQYSRTGYIWEQYDDVTGAGKGSHPFTGWSALLVLMAAEQ
ncbi:hypothetical protein N2152v2_011019 [Parachlorella kessleri]